MPGPVIVNQLVGLTLCFLMSVGAVGLGTVALRQQAFDLAKRNQSLEHQMAEVTRRLDDVRAEIAAAESVGALMRKNDEMRLGLHAPHESGVARVFSDPTLDLSRKANGLALAGDARTDLQIRAVPASFSLTPGQAKKPSVKPKAPAAKSTKPAKTPKPAKPAKTHPGFALR